MLPKAAFYISARHEKLSDLSTTSYGIDVIKHKSLIVVMAAVVVVAVGAVSFYWGRVSIKAEGRARIENRQLCDERAGAFGSDVWQRKKDNIDASWSAFVRDREDTPGAFGHFYALLWKEVNQRDDIAKATRRATSMCYEYFGIPR